MDLMTSKNSLSTQEENNVPLNLFRKFMITCVFSIVSTEVANVYILRLCS